MWDHRFAKSWRSQPKKILHSNWRPNFKLIGSILESKSKEVIYTQNPSGKFTCPKVALLRG